MTLTNTYQEYQVIEVVTDGHISCLQDDLGVQKYRHGYRGTDRKAALADLKHKRDVYGKYGRKFELQERTITETEWAK